MNGKSKNKRFIVYEVYVHMKFSKSKTKSSSKTDLWIYKYLE